MGIFSVFSNSTGGGGEDPLAPRVSNHAADYQKRINAYKKAWAAFQAELPDPVVIEGPSNDNVKINPANAVISTGVSFLFGKEEDELKFQVSPDVAERYGSTDVKGAKPTDQVITPPWLQDLNKVWKANRKKSFLHNLGISGAVTGTPFIKIVPNAAGLNNEFPRLLLLDPANVDVFWDPNDCTRVDKFCIEYITEDETGKPVLQIQEITANKDAFDITYSWTMQDYRQKMGFVLGTGFVPTEGDREPVGPPVEWPYAWAPIETCQNIEIPHEFWGMPDLNESSIEVIESYQRVMSSLNKIVRIHASPRMYAQNVMPDQIDEIDVSADNIITLPNMDANLSVLQTLSNLSPSIDYANKMMDDLLRMVQVPAIALGEFDRATGAASGISLSILFAPLIQKTGLKRISYGDMLERLNHKILTLMGYSPDEFESLIMVWPEMMPGSAYLERQTYTQDQTLGASSYTILSRLGYDPMEEQTRKSDEAERQLELQAKYAPKPEPGQGVGGGGNNNPAGTGNKNGSLGGVKAAGTPKTSSEDKKKPTTGK